MALTRVQAAAQVAAENAELFAALSVVATDVTGGLKEPLDAALRAVGVAEADLATATVDAGALAALRWYALRRLKGAAAANDDVQSLSAGGSSATFRGLVAQIDALIADAAADLVGYGIVVASNSWQAPGSLSTGFLEPVPSWAV